MSYTKKLQLFKCHYKRRKGAKNIIYMVHFHKRVYEAKIYETITWGKIVLNLQLCMQF